MSSVLDAIGNTPLVRLRRLAPANGVEVWVKLEHLNPSGSMKDRMALAMVEGAERDGLLEPDTTVVEYTGGSTGPALALVCRAKGYRALIVISDCFSDERIQLMRALGADARRHPGGRGEGARDGGGHPAHDRPRRRARRAAGALRDGSVQQPVHDRRHARLARPRDLGSRPADASTAFVQGVGTASSVVGVSQALKAERNVRVVALEPAGSPAITGGETRARSRCKAGRAACRRTGTRPPWTTSGRSRRGGDRDDAPARAEEGIFAGTSSGANVVGALRLAEQLEAGDVIVTLAVDSGFKYMTGPPYAV